MDTSNEENLHLFNIRLAKITGLYQILDPGTIKFCGRNVYHIVIVVFMLYSSVISTMLIVSCLYYSPKNIFASVEYGWKGMYSIFATYRLWNIVYHSNDVWNCLTITRYDFTSHNLRDRHILDLWRKRSVWITNTMAIVYFTTMLFFSGSFMLFRNDIKTIKNHDGSEGHYRQNLQNLFLIVTDETYNEYYGAFYVVEALFTNLLAILVFMFDMLQVTLCLAVSCQLQMINAAFESFGYESLSNPHTPIIDNTNEKQYLSNEHDIMYNELISIIKDYQAVLKKNEELLIIFERVTLLQVFISSISLIVLWFSSIMSLSGEDNFFDSEYSTIKIVCLIPSVTFQLFMMCSLFDNLNKQKDSIMFALYSSNWTEIDMKCKKLLLLTMKINSANQKTLKFTTSKIVNLELFFKIMSNCYTVVSVLINQIKSKDK